MSLKIDCVLCRKPCDLSPGWFDASRKGWWFDAYCHGRKDRVFVEGDGTLPKWAFVIKNLPTPNLASDQKEGAV